MNVLRKAAIISINVIVALDNPGLKALIALLIIILALRTLEAIRPYKKDIFTELESREMLSSVLTP